MLSLRTFVVLLIIKLAITSFLSKADLCGGLTQVTTAVNTEVTNKGEYSIIITIATNKECTATCQIISGPTSPRAGELTDRYSFTPFSKKKQHAQHYNVFRIKHLLLYEPYVYTCNLENEEIVNVPYTFPKNKKHVHIASYGDWTMGNSATSTYLLQNLEKYDALVTLGDYAYDLCDVGNEFMSFIRPISQAIPVMVTAGNHEGNNHCQNKNDKTDFADYINRFNMPDKKKFNNFYYSFDIGNVHFATINTDMILLQTKEKINDYYLDKDVGDAEEITEKMLTWLADDLKSAEKSKWKVVYAHRPFYTSFYKEKDGVKKDKNQVASDILQPYLEKIFLKHEVDIFIQADAHTYERLFPIKNGEAVQFGSAYVDPKAPIYLVCGTGGDAQGADFPTPYIKPTVFATRVNGFCDFTFNEDTIEFKFMNTDVSPPKSIDSFTLTKK